MTRTAIHRKSGAPKSGGTSNVARGARAKARTKVWLTKQGFHVADLEVVRWVWTPRGRLPIKRDQFASDLLAVDETRVVFVQVKSGASAKGGTFPRARREFATYTFPAWVDRWIVAWAPGARRPRVYGAILRVRRGRPVRRIARESLSSSMGPKIQS